MKKLLAYLIALVIAITSVFTGQIMTKTAAKAATLEIDGTEITAESGAPIEITTNEEGQTVYTLTGSVTNGLKITLAAGETVILDGKGYSIHGRDERLRERDSATSALEIAGSGTLILKNANLTGGNGNDEDGFYGQGAVALRVTSPNVSLILQQTVTITGGTAADGASVGNPSGNGSSGIEFSGAALNVDRGSQVTIKGSDGYQGISGNEYGHFRFDGTQGGCALNFTGGSLLVRDDAWLTLTGGNGGQGASGPEKVSNRDQTDRKIANGINGGNGGDALSFTGSVYTVSSSAKVTYTPGTGGAGGAAGTYYTDDYGTTLASGEAGSDGSAGLKLAYTSGLVPDKTLLQSALSEGDEVIAVTLHYSDDTQTYYAKKGSTINPAYLPDTEYYTVTKWYTDKSLQTPVGTGETITLTQDTKFYAEYTAATFKVSFSTGDDTIPVEDQVVTYPAAVTKPKDPTRRGYTFGGWYTDEACTKVYILDQPVTKDMTLHAKWTINTHTVSFDSLGGSSVDVETADYETAVTKPEDPTKTGYTFGGWYTDEACTNAYDFATPVTGDMILYAKWNEIPRPTGTPQPTKAPKPTVIPTSEPTGTPQPTKVPEPTVIPTSEPTGTPQPTKAPEPTVIPTLEPTGTPQPTKAPESTVIPTLEPTGTPQATGTPQPMGVPQPTVAPTETSGSVTVSPVPGQTTISPSVKNEVLPVMMDLIQPVISKNVWQKLRWTKVKGADGYFIYASRCSEGEDIRNLKLVCTITSAGKTSFINKKLKEDTWYKYEIQAYRIVNGKKTAYGRSLQLHALTKGSKKYANPLKVRITGKKKRMLKLGETSKIKAKVVLPNGKKCKWHIDKIRYVVSNPEVLSVSKKGKITTKKAGKATVYAIAQNGVMNKIKIKVTK